MRKAHNFIDLTGNVFGRLVVISRVENVGNGGAKWLCLCECGEYAEVRACKLRGQQTKSCGCFVADAHKTHGLSGTPEYKAWFGMISRCTNKNNARYYQYGGRGISVCKRWMSPANFIKDMGKKPDGLSLDRENNEGNYDPDNCRWATIYEQNNNRRGCIGYGVPK